MFFVFDVYDFAGGYCSGNHYGPFKHKELLPLYDYPFFYPFHCRFKYCGDS